jgi:DNA-directed RNA polymerase subunit RPC12/RpoP
MFIKETTEKNSYTKKSKYGKLISYERVKTLTHWKCDNCGKEFIKNKNGKYSKTSKSFCKHCISKIGLNKLASMAGYDSKVENQFEPKLGQIIIDKEGYRQIYIGKNYPFRKGGYTHIREHQYIMEIHLNRPLVKGEVIHHIDGNKQNNDLDNLFLTTVNEHNKLHAESESIIFDLYKKGLVTFDKKLGRYKIVNQ